MSTRRVKLVILSATPGIIEASLKIEPYNGTYATLEGRKPI
jgi:hypothetical protein